METNVKIEKIMDKNVLIHDNLKMLALTSASMIIKECKAWRPNGEKSVYPKKGTILGDLNLLMDWSQNGFISALQSHVDIVYAVIKYNLEIPQSDLWFVYHEAVFITEALETYQRWKESVIRKSQKMYGEDWGSATEFNCAVWNDKNADLLDLYIS
ncbi:hypothetical protein KAU33_09205 [Candidatus Dependentiae bacterium]|nr:hypothetical protein [Candidatus Dependentiae bacterium]